MPQSSLRYALLPKGLIPGMVMLAVLLGLCLAGLIFLNSRAECIDLSARLQAPSLSFPCGTDSLGRCVLSRSLIGSLTSVSASLAALGLTLGIGLPMGIAAGLGPKACDTVIMCMTDIVLAFPLMILALSLAGLLGASLGSCILAIGLAGWGVWTRLARGMILSTREKEYVKAARVMGIQGVRLTLSYILPDVLPSIITAACLHVGTLLIFISGLSFLGFGPGPELPELGSMLRNARIYLASAPWTLVTPGVMIIWSISSFYVLGSGLRRHFQIRDDFVW